jgi:hypothetical protein
LTGGTDVFSLHHDRLDMTGVHCVVAGSIVTTDHHYVATDNHCVVTDNTNLQWL